MFRRFAISTLVATLTLGFMITGATSATASASEEQGFVRRINAARAERGLRALVVRSDLVSVARRHSADMAAEGAIWHNPELPEQVHNWERLGENVGVGASVDELHEAFMDSTSHRANILKGAYNEVGVGVVITEGTIYVTEVFAQRFSSSRVVTRKVVRKAKAPSAPRRSTRASSVAPARAAAPAAAPQAPAAAAPQAVDVLLRIVSIDQ